MTVPSYTEEDVELVARVLNGKSLFDEPAASSIYLDPLRDSYRDQARVILAALSSAGRLVPPGSEVREEWGNRFTWVDSGHTEDYAAMGGGRRDAERTQAFHEQHRLTDPRWIGRAPIIRRLHIVTPWSPSVPDTKEGS